MTTLVFQFDTNDRIQWMWMDVGKAYILQCPEHRDQLELIAQG
jgi:uncharacterized protein YwqG